MKVRLEMSGRPNQGLSHQARLWLTEAQDSRIAEIAEKMGVTKSEVIRQALDAKLDSASLELLIRERLGRVEAVTASVVDEQLATNQSLSALEDIVQELAKLICFALPSPTDPEKRKAIQAAGVVRFAEFSKQIQAAKRRGGVSTGEAQDGQSNS